jgi:hypothetical protein
MRPLLAALATSALWLTSAVLPAQAADPVLRPLVLPSSADLPALEQTAITPVGKDPWRALFDHYVAMNGDLAGDAGFLDSYLRFTHCDVAGRLTDAGERERTLVLVRRQMLNKRPDDLPLPLAHLRIGGMLGPQDPTTGQFSFAPLRGDVIIPIAEPPHPPSACAPPDSADWPRSFDVDLLNDAMVRDPVVSPEIAAQVGAAPGRDAYADLLVRPLAMDGTGAEVRVVAEIVSASIRLRAPFGDGPVLQEFAPEALRAATIAALADQRPKSTPGMTADGDSFAYSDEVLGLAWYAFVGMRPMVDATGPVRQRDFTLSRPIRLRLTAEGTLDAMGTLTLDSLDAQTRFGGTAFGTEQFELAFVNAGAFHRVDLPVELQAALQNGGVAVADIDVIAVGIDRYSGAGPRRVMGHITTLTLRVSPAGGGAALTARFDSPSQPTRWQPPVDDRGAEAFSISGVTVGVDAVTARQAIEANFGINLRGKGDALVPPPSTCPLTPTGELALQPTDGYRCALGRVTAGALSHLEIAEGIAGFQVDTILSALVAQYGQPTLVEDGILRGEAAYVGKHLGWGKKLASGGHVLEAQVWAQDDVTVQTISLVAGPLAP